jgi:competence protein ComEC
MLRGGAAAVVFAVAVVLAVAVGPLAAARTLDIYFIDVEGGQATLIVTPRGESLLVDAGFAGSGAFESKPGDPRQARDAQRILAATREAGVKRIDYLLVTHFHADHDGGVVELAQQIPIRTFIDAGTASPQLEETSRGALAMFEAYAAVRARGRHLVPRPGNRLPLKGIDAVVVSAGGSTIGKPLEGAGDPTANCAASAPPPQEPNENPRSLGFRLRFGRFRFLDLGDLTGAPLFALACPANRVGPVDVYLVTHHGGVDAADPATFAAFKPRVAIVNNGPRKGGAPETFAALRQAAGLEDAWQLHRSEPAGPQNLSDDRIANVDDTTAHWIKLSATADGSFRVENGRTGESRAYAPR